MAIFEVPYYAITNTSYLTVEADNGTQAEEMAKDILNQNESDEIFEFLICSNDVKEIEER